MQSRFRPVLFHTFDLRHKAQIFDDTHVIVKRRILMNVANLAPKRERIAKDIVSRDGYSSGRRRQISRQNAKDAAFPGPIGSEQTDDLAFFNGKRNITESKARPVPLHEVLSDDDFAHYGSTLVASLAGARSESATLFYVRGLPGKYPMSVKRPLTDKDRP